MKPTYHQLKKYLTNVLSTTLIVKSSSQGFTLLELIVVFVFAGILSAVAIPVFLGQIGKSREAESLLVLGSMTRSQQAYHYVNGQFAPTLTQLANDAGPLTSKYHDLNNFTVASNPESVKMQIIALNPGQDQVRNYAAGVYFINSSYLRATCQGAFVGAAVQVGNLPADPCSNNGIKIN